MKLISGHEVVSLPDDEQKEQKDLFLAYSEGLMQLHPGKWTYTKAFERFADKIYEFEFKPSDIVIMSFPKSGSTWMQEIIWNIIKGPNDEDKSFPVSIRCPFIEGDFLFASPNALNPEFNPNVQNFLKKYDKGQNEGDGHFLRIAKCTPELRIMKTHLPFSLLNPKMLDTCKVIYVVRNPKDVCVSFYHHSRSLKTHNYLGDVDKFCELLVNDKVVYGPMWPFLQEGWERRSHHNFHLVFYEDLKADSFKELSRLDHFLGTELTAEQIKIVVEHTSFTSMKERDVFTSAPRDAPSPFLDREKGEFFRKGETGTWKDEISAEQDKVMNDWIKENYNLAPFDFKYKI